MTGVGVVRQCVSSFLVVVFVLFETEGNGEI
jgi:hypothetical protein